VRDGVEAGRAGEARHERPARRRAIAVDHREPHVAHVERDRIPEDQRLQHGQAEDHEPHARVAQDGAELLAEDGEDAFAHGQR